MSYKLAKCHFEIYGRGHDPISKVSSVFFHRCKTRLKKNDVIDFWLYSMVSVFAIILDLTLT